LEKFLLLETINVKEIKGIDRLAVSLKMGWGHLEGLDFKKDMKVWRKYKCGNKWTNPLFYIHY
jgi:hypothetical protein